MTYFGAEAPRPVGTAEALAKFRRILATPEWSYRVGYFAGPLTGFYDLGLENALAFGVVHFFSGRSMTVDQVTPTQILTLIRSSGGSSTSSGISGTTAVGLEVLTPAEALLIEQDRNRWLTGGGGTTFVSSSTLTSGPRAGETYTGDAVPGTTVGGEAQTTAGTVALLAELDKTPARLTLDLGKDALTADLPSWVNPTNAQQRVVAVKLLQRVLGLAETGVYSADVESAFEAWAAGRVPSTTIDAFLSAPSAGPLWNAVKLLVRAARDLFLAGEDGGEDGDEDGDGDEDLAEKTAGWGTGTKVGLVVAALAVVGAAAYFLTRRRGGGVRGLGGLGGFDGLPEIRSFVAKETGGRPEAICDFLDVLSEEAHDVAMHVESNWQDPVLARYWSRISKQMDEARAKCAKSLPPEYQ